MPRQFNRNGGERDLFSIPACAGQVYWTPCECRTNLSGGEGGITPFASLTSSSSLVRELPSELGIPLTHCGDLNPTGSHVIHFASQNLPTSWEEPVWRRGRDSNPRDELPRLLDFESSAFDHSSHLSTK